MYITFLLAVLLVHIFVHILTGGRAKLEFSSSAVTVGFFSFLGALLVGACQAVWRGIQQMVANIANSNTRASARRRRGSSRDNSATPTATATAAGMYVCVCTCVCVCTWRQSLCYICPTIISYAIVTFVYFICVCVCMCVCVCCQIRKFLIPYL